MTEQIKRLEIELEITNSLGLHARPASMFVQLASSFDSEILVEKDGEQVSAKSLMGLLMLAAGCGTVIKVLIQGPDSDSAMEAVTKLINSKFNEE